MSNKKRKVSEKKDSYYKLENGSNNFESEVSAIQRQANHEIDLANDAVKIRIFGLYDEIEDLVGRIKQDLNVCNEELNLTQIEKDMSSIKRELQSVYLLNHFKFNSDAGKIHYKVKSKGAQK